MNVLGVGLGVIGSFPEHILLLPGWIVVVLVFAFQALEASAFVGFVFPREITVILGGVAASQGIVPLWAVIVAAVSGAIIGDSIGYLIGRRWGTHLLYGTVGRLPVIRGELDKHLGSAQAYVRLRKGRAVFFGRFTAALRVLVPGLAGLSKVPYPSFLAYNVAGGLVWGSVFVILGYLAGASYARVEQVASRAGLGLLALVVLSLVLARVLRGLGQRFASLNTFGDAGCNATAQLGTPAVPKGSGVGRASPRHDDSAGVLAHVHPNRGRTCCLGIRRTDSGRHRTRRDGPVRSPCRAVDRRGSNR